MVNVSQSDGSSSKLPLVILTVNIAEAPLIFLLDCGSTVNLITEKVLRAGIQLKKASMNVKTLGKNPIPLCGVIERVQIQKNSATLGNQNFVVTSAPMTTFDGILGMPFLKSLNVVLDFEKEEARIRSHRIPFFRTINAEMHTCQHIEQKTEEPDCLYHMRNEVNQTNVKVTAMKNTKWPAMSQGLIKVRVPKIFANKTLVMEPVEMKQGIAIGGALVKPDKQGRFVLPALNVTDSGVEVRQDVHIGYAYILTDNRLIIGAEEVYTEEEYYKLQVDNAREKEEIHSMCHEMFVNHLGRGGLRPRRKGQRKPDGWEPGRQQKPGWEPESSDEGQKRASYGRLDVLGTPGSDVQGTPGSDVLGTHAKSNEDSQRLPMGISPRHVAVGKMPSKHRVLEPITMKATENFDLLREIEFEKIDKLAISTDEVITDDAKVKEIIDTMIKGSECPNDFIPQLRAVLWKYKKVLANSGDPVGLCTAYKPAIKLDTEDPVYTPQYLVPFKMREAMRESVVDFLKQGIIQESTSPYNSPSLMVPKRDGGYRMVIDFRKLNIHVVTDPYPLPRIAQILETLGDAVIFTALDLLNGFYNLEIAEKDRGKTAFSTYEGHYQFIRLPMGLKNSPSVFQRLMSIVLSGCLGSHAFIYIDDILVFSKTPTDHIKHLDDILSRLHQAGLRVKASKCQLWRHEVEYLGFLAGKDGLRVNPRKLDAIKHFPKPEKVRDVQAFLGLIGYFRIFISSFATRAASLYDLLKKEQEWSWDKPQDAAFQELKICLLKAPVLAFPDFSKPFLLTTDASGYAVGAILTQVQKGKERLIACTSRVLTKSEKNYSNVDRETLGVVNGVESFRSYLWGNKFVIHTDNSAIAAISKQETSTHRRAVRWYLLLNEYDYTMQHRKANTIQHADALSRYPVSTLEQEINSLSEFTFQLSSQIPTGLVNYLSPAFQQAEYEPIFNLAEWRRVMKRTTKPVEYPESSNYKFIEEEELIYRVDKEDQEKRQIWVPPLLRDNVMRIYHDPPSAGHVGIERMALGMKRTVYWPHLHEDVKTYCQTCKVCQQYKHHNPRTPQSRKPIPSKCLEDISIDVVGPVPSAWSGAKYVLVIQDRLSRYIVFSAMSNQTADTVARVFLADWICHFGAPRRLVTDRGSNFMSVVFETLCEFLGTTHSPTCAYRPQGNAQNERSHQQLHNYLAMYLEESSAASWDLLLQQAAWVHNTTVHTALGRSPFEILTGQEPRSAIGLIKDQQTAKSKLTLEEYFDLKSEQLEELRQRAKEIIERAQAMSMVYQNQSARLEKYKPGDEVWVRKHGTKLIDKKWGKKFDGPFVVLEAFSPQAIKVSLKADPTYKDIVHTSRVRRFYPRPMEIESPEIEPFQPQEPFRFEEEDEEGEIVPHEPAFSRDPSTIVTPDRQDMLFDRTPNEDTSPDQWQRLAVAQPPDMPSDGTDYPHIPVTPWHSPKTPEEKSSEKSPSSLTRIFRGLWPTPYKSPQTPQLTEQKETRSSWFNPFSSTPRRNLFKESKVPSYSPIPPNDSPQERWRAPMRLPSTPSSPEQSFDPLETIFEPRNVRTRDDTSDERYVSVEDPSEDPFKNVTQRDPKFKAGFRPSTSAPHTPVSSQYQGRLDPHPLVSPSRAQRAAAKKAEEKTKATVHLWAKR